MKNIICRREFYQIFFLVLSLGCLIVGNSDQAATYIVGSLIIGCMDMKR